MIGTMARDRVTRVKSLIRRIRVRVLNTHADGSENKLKVDELDGDG